MAENGTTSYPQSIDSRHSGRPHDPGHDPTETDQVWTCPELARVILHILGPTCTVTSVTPITATLTVLMNTVNNFQNHRLTIYLGSMIETRSTVREKNSSQPSTKTVLYPPNASVNVASMMTVTDSANSASTKEAIENDVAQAESVGGDVASFCRRHCTIRREVGSNECEKCEKEAAEKSKSEAELVDEVDTLKRAISEQMSEGYSEVAPNKIRLPPHQRTVLVL